MLIHGPDDANQLSEVSAALSPLPFLYIIYLPRFSWLNYITFIQYSNIFKLNIIKYKMFPIWVSWEEKTKERGICDWVVMGAPVAQLVRAPGQSTRVDPGGQVVIILSTGSEFRWFKPGQGQWIFSEHKNPEYDFLRKGRKAIGPVSYIYVTWKYLKLKLEPLSKICLTFHAQCRKQCWWPEMLKSVIKHNNNRI